MENFRGLSLRGKLLLFNSPPAKNDALTVSSFSFDPRRNAFVAAAHGHGAAVAGGKPSTQRGDVVKCARAVDTQRSSAAACVLLRSRQKGGNFRYSVLSVGCPEEEPTETRVEFTLPYRVEGDVFILRGPTVAWRHAGGVCYASPREAGVKTLPCEWSSCVAGELPLNEGRAFVLGVEKQPTKQCVGCYTESGRTFDPCAVLPHHYIRVTRCLAVLTAEHVGDELKVAVVAATSAQQLVYVESGVVKHACRLPFEDAEEIHEVHAGRSGLLLVVSFHHGHVCAIWRESFQIASRWSGVISVHVDDFVGCGTDQILLLFKDEGVTGRPLESFILTDLCGISYSRGQTQGAPKISAPPSENYLLTLRALESRLQSGLTVLQDLQREVRVKERVVQQAVRALTDAASETRSVLTQPEQEGLVALWDCSDESKDEASDDKTQDMPATSPGPRVDKLWHRIAEDRMVVGVILTADSSVPVASLSLSILTETGQSSTPAVIQTQSQVFWLPALSPSSSSSSSSSSFSSAATFSEPAAKRSKQHDTGRPNDLNTCGVAVTAVTRVTPLLNSGCVKCRVMLHYVHRRDSSALDPVPTVLHCGQVDLDIHTDLNAQLLKNPELKTDEVKEDFLSVLSLLDHWAFLIDSPDHSLGDIDGWFRKRVGCKPVEVSPQYLLLNSSPSALALLHWHQITPFQGELSVHSSRLQMLQLLDSLLAHLPVSCSVRPVKATQGHGAAQIFSLALEKEAVSLRELASSLVRAEPADEVSGRSSAGHAEPPVPDSAEGLQGCREVWQRDAERSRKSLGPLLDVARYRRLIQRLTKVQLDGDLAALAETQRTLLS